MASYVVTWSIDIEDVDSPEQAALAALAIQRDQESMATVFEVQKMRRVGLTGLMPDSDIEKVFL